MDTNLSMDTSPSIDTSPSMDTSISIDTGRAADANATVARNLRRFRHERHLSLAHLSRIAGLSKQTLSTLESGQGNPTVDTLTCIAEALGVPLHRLIVEYGTVLRVQRANEAQWNDERDRATRELDQIFGSGHVRTSLLRLTAGAPPRITAPHSTGTIHHAYVVSGRVRLGPLEEPVDLGPSDFIRYPGDVPHLTEPLRGESLLHVVTTRPHVPQFSALGE